MSNLKKLAVHSVFGLATAALLPGCGVPTKIVDDFKKMDTPVDWFERTVGKFSKDRGKQNLFKNLHAQGCIDPRIQDSEVQLKDGLASWNKANGKSYSMDWALHDTTVFAKGKPCLTKDYGQANGGTGTTYKLDDDGYLIDAIKAKQYALIEKGCLNDRADGDVGPKTREAMYALCCD